MEISLESRLILAAKAARPKSAEIEEAGAAETAASAQEARMDRLTLTNQTIEKLAEQSERLKNLLEQTAEAAKPLEPIPFPWEASAEEEKSRDELDAMEEGLKAMRKCQEIAARIMRGDKVPPQDERYLMENDPEGFKLALAMRQPKKHPKECKSVLDEEDRTAKSSGGEETGADPSCEETGGTSDSGE